MTEPTPTHAFINALAVLEQDRDVKPLAALFAPESEIGNVVSPRQFSGPEGARAFWEAYRATFDDVQSEFRTVVSSDGRAALEWTTRGTSVQGAPISYTGVSILEFSGEQISRFWVCFDPGALGRQMAEGASSR